MIAFRDVLIHGYATVDPRMVWRAVEEDLPGLRDTSALLLSRFSE